MPESEAKSEKLLKEIELTYLLDTRLVVPFPETVTALSCVQSVNARLGIVSSSTRKMVETILDCFGLGHLFEVVVAYEDCAESKPNPEPLLFACKNLGEFERGYYVGDMAEDAIAARRAGLVPVLLSRNGSFNTRVRLASSNTNIAQDLWEAVGYIGRSAEQDLRQRLNQVHNSCDARLRLLEKETAD